MSAGKGANFWTASRGNRRNPSVSDRHQVKHALPGWTDEVDGGGTGFLTTTHTPAFPPLEAKGNASYSSDGSWRG